MIEVHLTRAADARVSPYGWRRLPSGVWVTTTPLVDRANHPNFAHLDYETLLAVCARIKGARPIKPAHVVELNWYGHRLTPVILPPDTMMSSKARCDEHDARVWALLAQADWDGTLPVGNAGKPYVEGAQPGRSRLIGWSKSKQATKLGPHDFDHWYQPLQNAHNRRHVDYSSLQTLEADNDLGLEDADEAA